MNKARKCAEKPVDCLKASGDGIRFGMFRKEEAGAAWIEFTAPPGDGEVVFSFTAVSPDNPPLPLLTLAVNGKEICSERLFKAEEPVRTLHFRFRGTRLWADRHTPVTVRSTFLA